MSKETAGRGATVGETTPKIHWDDSDMKSTYANVCNVTGTQEEVVLFFGISHPKSTGEPEVSVKLSDRIILSPFAARRLAQLLTRAVDQWQQRFGHSSGIGSSAPLSSAQETVADRN